MTTLVKYLIRFYQNTFSLILKVFFGGGCRFSPTCSEYAHDSFEKHGPLKGTFLSFKRVIKCNPMSEPGFDPVK